MSNPWREKFDSARARLRNRNDAPWRRWQRAWLRASGVLHGALPQLCALCAAPCGATLLCAPCDGALPRLDSSLPALRAAHPRRRSVRALRRGPAPVDPRSRRVRLRLSARPGPPRLQVSRRAGICADACRRALAIGVRCARCDRGAAAFRRAPARARLQPGSGDRTAARTLASATDSSTPSCARATLPRLPRCRGASDSAAWKARSPRGCRCAGARWRWSTTCSPPDPRCAPPRSRCRRRVPRAWTCGSWLVHFRQRERARRARSSDNMETRRRTLPRNAVHLAFTR